MVVASQHWKFRGAASTVCYHVLSWSFDQLLTSVLVSVALSSAMEAQPIVIPAPKPKDEDEEEYVPDDAEKEEAELAEQRRKQLEEEAAQRDTDALRRDAKKRMGMLDSLLDKTALYSQFVSSNIKVVEKNPRKKDDDEDEEDDEDEDEEEEEAEEEAATRSGKKRSPAAPKSKKAKKAKTVKKDKFDLNELQAAEAAEQQRQAGKPDLIVGDMRDYQLQGVAWCVIQDPVLSILDPELSIPDSN